MASWQKSLPAGGCPERRPALTQAQHLRQQLWQHAGARGGGPLLTQRVDVTIFGYTLQTSPAWPPGRPALMCIGLSCLPSLLSCRASANSCDAAEKCTGSSPTCPADMCKGGSNAMPTAPFDDDRNGMTLATANNQP